MDNIPEDIKERLARVAATFIAKHDVPAEDVQEFMVDVIGIYDDYMTRD